MFYCFYVNKQINTKIKILYKYFKNKEILKDMFEKSKAPEK